MTYNRVRYRNWLSSKNPDSGARTVEDFTIPKYTTTQLMLMSREDPGLLLCSCDVGARPDNNNNN